VSKRTFFPFFFLARVDAQPPSPPKPVIWFSSRGERCIGLALFQMRRDFPPNFLFSLQNVDLPATRA